MVSTLIVVAHPDDEVLGCGGTAALLARAGVPVHVCIMSGSAEARGGRPDVTQLHLQAREALGILGLPEPTFGSFPNIAFNTVPHLDLVRFIEGAMRKTSATHLYTHHPADLNDDHHQVSRACQAAARLSQRGGDVPPLERLAFMEIPSSTDWSFPAGSQPFEPTAFVELGEEILALKLRALAAYAGVMRPYPHPRSEEVVRGLAAIRGGQAGGRYAEAFQLAFERIRPT